MGGAVAVSRGSRAPLGLSSGRPSALPRHSSSVQPALALLGLCYGRTIHLDAVSEGEESRGREGGPGVYTI